MRIWPLVFASTSDSVLPAAKLPSLTNSWLLNTRGVVSASGGSRSGSRGGATSQRNSIANPPTITTGSAKSNMPNSLMPMSCEIPTTSRFVEVPIVVAMPPIIVARPIGNMTSDTGNFTRIDTPTRIGRSRTTIGVLFMNALSTPPATSVTRVASSGRVDQARLTTVASGCNAPVVSSALPTIISAQIVTRASLPNPAKNCTGPRGSPSVS